MRFSCSRRQLLTYFGFLLVISLLFCGCGKASAFPCDIVRAMQNAEKPSPAGRLFILSALEEEDGYIEEDLLAATFGDGILPPELEYVEDAAFFFAFQHPCEFSVFLCNTSVDTDAVAQMCLRRLSYLKSYWKDRDEATYVQHASVTVRGRWVILCVSSDTENALRAFREAL